MVRCGIVATRALGLCYIQSDSCGDLSASEMENLSFQICWRNNPGSKLWLLMFHFVRCLSSISNSHAERLRHSWRPARKLIASKDASDALRLYAEHVEERTHTLSQQFQEISSLAVQIGAANKSEKLDDTSVTKKSAIKQDSPGTPTVPNALGTGKATAPSSHSGANGGLTSQVATALPSPPRAANRGGKGKKPRKIQNGPTEGGAASKPRKQRRPHRGAS
jgi:hypothetical protein